MIGCLTESTTSVVVKPLVSINTKNIIEQVRLFEKVSVTNVSKANRRFCIQIGKSKTSFFLGSIGLHQNDPGNGEQSHILVLIVCSTHHDNKNSLALQPLDEGSAL